jgi:hypothetical protein
LEDELNDKGLLEKLYYATYKLLCISPQPIAPEVFAEKCGEVILQYAKEQKIDPHKIVALMATPQQDELQACRILGYTAISLMSEYEILPGGGLAIS